VDYSALTDRFYADMVSTSLRASAAFLSAKTTIAQSDLEAYGRERATIHLHDLSLTEAEGESAFDDAMKQCAADLPGSTADGSITASKPYRAVTLLARTAKRLLQRDGREMILRVDRQEPGREILRWRFVSLSLPPSILIAAATTDDRASPSAVRLLHPSISPDVPVAQQHVHHAAMMSFEQLWAWLQLRALFRRSELGQSLRDTRATCPRLHLGACIRERSDAAKKRAKKRPADSARHMDQWGELIYDAIIAARVLDRHTGHTGPLELCPDRICGEGMYLLRSFRKGNPERHRLAQAVYPWPDELLSRARRYRDANARAAFRRSQEPRRQMIDEQAAAERRLLARAFSHLRSNDSTSPDGAYETLFLQYLRVKTALFGLLVHPPGEHGLEKFLEHFEQIKVYAPDADILSPRVPDEPGLRVHSTEYRVATDAWLKILERRDRHIEAPAVGDEDHHEAAWLIHFKRKPRKNTLPFFGAAVRELEAEATQIGNALAQDPTRLRELRGLDICGVEEAQPLWVSVETLRSLRARSSKIAGRRPELRLEPLRLTLHAGEDFQWLTSGMRAAAEPFHWNLIERGDRIGHGIAITLHPKAWWARKEGKVIDVKRFDRLLDLAFLAKYADPTPAQQVWLRENVEECLRELRLSLDFKGAKKDALEAAMDLWLHLGGPLTRRLMKTMERPEDEIHANWIHRYLWDQSLQERAGKVIRLPVDEDRTERDLLLKARAWVIHQVARLQVSIESNPSSNLVVGSLDAVAAQDFLARRPTRKAPYGKETLTWTISTDDPITFSTTLADEYAYAWAGMVLRKDKPYDPSYARALLDEAAATSMRTRFTVPRKDPDCKGKDTRKGRGNARSA
jgi:hypothetical protein